MCRGCRIDKNGEPSVYEYLNWLDECREITWKMKNLEKRLHGFAEAVDLAGHKKALDRLHKAMIKTRKKYSGLDAKYLVGV